MNITEYVASQFGNPRGFLGKICCLLQNRVNHAMYGNIIDAIKVDSNTNVLDIGFGNGYLIQQIYKRGCGKISGIDISEDILHEAYEKNKEGIQSGDIKLSVGDCCNLQFDNETFDYVTSVNTIYFWENTIKGLQEIRRTLKDGGVFCNVVYTKEY